MKSYLDWTKKVTGGVDILHPMSLFMHLLNKFFCCLNELNKNVFIQILSGMAGIEIVTKQDLIEMEEKLVSELRRSNGKGEEPKLGTDMKA